MNQLAPIILASEPKAAVAVCTKAPRLHVALRDYRGRRYLIAVNATEEAVSAMPAVEGLRANKADVLFEGRQAAVSAGVVNDRFGKLAVHVYRFD